MLINAIRRQARTALVSVVRRTAVPSLVAHVSRPTPISLRALSTTLVLRFEEKRTSESEPSRQLFVGNVPFDATEHDIRDAFKTFGEVETVRLITNLDGSSRGFGYVMFRDVESSTAAFNSGPIYVYDRDLRIDYSAPKTYAPPRNAGAAARPAAPPGRVLFAGNLPFGCEEADLREKFEPFGTIKSVRIGRHASGESKGFAHIEYMREEDAVATYDSFAEEPLYLLDRTIRVDYAPARPTIVHPPSHKLYFHDFRGDDAALRLALKEFENSIQHVYFLRNQATGEITGTGFIDFMSVERATDAIAKFNGTISSYGPINLEYAAPPKREREENKGRGGGNNYPPERTSYGGGQRQANVWANNEREGGGGYGGGQRQGGGGYGGGQGGGGYGGRQGGGGYGGGQGGGGYGERQSGGGGYGGGGGGGRGGYGGGGGRGGGGGGYGSR
ncbi:hypothetical protein B0H15DRAFT_950996 [Mycena belliarum]|uniref:RRM domain-containing protein n=1 Tax=Mycena belliarum TaxID=1033014 RepID=A0AAD6XKQ3_9AGAR|nr:hypothetical protein B0H15DRAFT_950996 [Mycena belliae]